MFQLNNNSCCSSQSNTIDPIIHISVLVWSKYKNANKSVVILGFLLLFWKKVNVVAFVGCSTLSWNLIQIIWIATQKENIESFLYHARLDHLLIIYFV